MNLKKILFTAGAILAIIFLPAYLASSISGDMYRQSHNAIMMNSLYQVGGIFLIAILVMVAARFMKVSLGTGFWTWILGVGVAMLSMVGFAAANMNFRKDLLPMIVVGFFGLMAFVGFIMFIAEAFRSDPISLSFEKGIASNDSGGSVSPEELQNVVAKIRGFA